MSQRNSPPADERPVLLLISGSLRRTSSNTTVLERAGQVGDDLFRSVLYTGIPDLPAFNPDIEELGEGHPDFPSHARELRQLVGRANAMLVSTPEYAHGLPGAFKNCLDWLVGGSEFPDMPFGLINVAPHSQYASAQCLEIAATMSARIVQRACVVLDKQDTPLGATLSELDPRAAAVLRDVVEGLADAVRSGSREVPGRE